MEKQTFLFAICETKNQKIVEETLRKNRIQIKSNRTIGGMNVFYLQDTESNITRLGCSLVSLKNTFPMEILLFDEGGVI